MIRQSFLLAHDSGRADPECGCCTVHSCRSRRTALRSAPSGALYCNCRLAGCGLDSLAVVGCPAVYDSIFPLLLLLLLPCTTFSLPLIRPLFPALSSLIAALHLSLSAIRIEASHTSEYPARSPYGPPYINYSLIRLDAGRNSEIGTTEPDG